MQKRIYFSLLFLFASCSFAAPYTIDGETKVYIYPNSKDSIRKKPMEFTLPRVKLSAESKRYLKAQLEKYTRSPSRQAEAFKKRPDKIVLGMGKTPVLDQGEHGTCATFAATAAIDALLQKGDYISQLCSLELGKWRYYHHQIESSGWEGAFMSTILRQLRDYGIVTKKYQKSHGCAGLRYYPRDNPYDEGNLMSPASYTNASIPIAHQVTWQSLMKKHQAFSPAFKPNKQALRVMKELEKGNRVLVVLLLDPYLDDAGALGNYWGQHDAWMLTPKIIAEANHDRVNAGHSLIITGYVRDQEVMDDKGYSNRGFFILRNCWSADAGYKGNYIVSFDYFKYFTGDLNVIRARK